jgi:hypothetical protein
LGRERSVVEDEKVWENQPDRRSPIRGGLADEEEDRRGSESGAEVSNLVSVRLLVRGIATGSARSSSLRPRNLLPIRNLLDVGVLNTAESIELVILLVPLLILPPSPGSVTDLDRSRLWFCRCRNFGSFEVE